MNKSVILFSILFIFSMQNLLAQWPNNSGSLSTGKSAAVKWEQKIIDIGEVEQYVMHEVVYKFKNKGGKPIIITNAKGSCGCTEIEYSRKPILPGQSSTIIVNFDAEDSGVFNKTVTITMNIENSSQVLRLKGTVIK